MANTYVITSVTSVGDNLTVIGTVNGIQVGLVTSLSKAGNAMASAIAFENYIAPLMLAAVPPTPTVYGALNLSFSQ